MIRSLKTGGRVLVVSAVALGTVPFGTAGYADTIRTDTTLAGFNVTVEATPLRVLLDDPELQIPHDPGTAIAEGDPNYTLASVSAGPNAHALTSNLWPGNLLGEGVGQLGVPGPVQDYPIKGEARYPDKPYDASSVDKGKLTSAHAEGLDATATADGTPTNKPGQIMVGAVTSSTNATVNAKNVAVGTATSAVSDINLLAGIVKIGAVKTVISTSADGTKPASTGTTTVGGLTIAGNAFSVDGTGIHAAGQSVGLPAISTPDAVGTALGISAHTVTQTITKVNGGVSRVAGGLIIDVDTGPLRKLLAPATGVVNPIANSLISNLPDAVASNLYYFVKATPHITFIFASADSVSAATLPLKLPPFTFPKFPITPGTVITNPGGSTGGGTGGVSPLPNIGTGSTGGNTPIVNEGGTTGAASNPQVLPPTIAAGSTTDAGFSGIGAGWLLGALLGAGLIGWGLLRFLGLAGGSLLGIGCRLGAPTSVPDLRSVTA